MWHGRGKKSKFWLGNFKGREHLRHRLSWEDIKENNHPCPSPKAKQRVEMDEVCGTGELRKAILVRKLQGTRTLETPTKMGG
jgi:hypothetical protein